jgi:hypothetical protein
MALTPAEKQSAYRAREAARQAALEAQVAALEAQVAQIAQEAYARGYAAGRAAAEEAARDPQPAAASPPLDAQTDVLANQIAQRFSAGKWHGVRAIASATHADLAIVHQLLDLMVAEGAFATVAERRPAPAAHGSCAYRLRPGGTQTIALAALHAELAPVLDDMEKVINGHSVDFSQQAMKLAFAEFRKVIQRVAR